MLMEQLDGSNDISEDDKYRLSRHYWKTGYLGTTYQQFLDALDIIEESELSENEKLIEKKKVLGSRKDAFGENYKYYPPWDKKQSVLGVFHLHHIQGGFFTITLSIIHLNLKSVRE